jgi:hypothetical protein
MGQGKIFDRRFFDLSPCHILYSSGIFNLNPLVLAPLHWNRRGQGMEESEG